MTSLKTFALFCSLAWQLVSAQERCPSLKLNTGLAPLLGDLPISNCAPDLPSLPNLPTLPSPDCANFPSFPGSGGVPNPYLSEFPSIPDTPPFLPNYANIPPLPATGGIDFTPYLSELPPETPFLPSSPSLGSSYPELPSIPNIPCLPEAPCLPPLPSLSDLNGFDGSFQQPSVKGCLANKKPCCLRKGIAPPPSLKMKLLPIKKCGLKNPRCDYPLTDCYY